VRVPTVRASGGRQALDEVLDCIRSEWAARLESVLGRRGLGGQDIVKAIALVHARALQVACGNVRFEGFMYI
jgi:hypothetical protein